MQKDDVLKPITWSEVEANLNNLTAVDGGFSQAHRGLVNLADGRQVFVKIGTDEESRAWANKEIALYRFLKARSFSAIPELLCTNASETAFCLEPLTASDGWDWSDSWTVERLAATLKAMNDLAELRPKGESWMSLGQLALDESRDGWGPLAQSPELQQELLNKIRAAGQAKVAEALNFDDQAKRSARFAFRADTFVHHDVRADNCVWNPATNQVKLVDWNWAQMGDARVDSAAMLVHVQKSGLDISLSQAVRLDADALQWMAGFWLKAAATPIWPGGPTTLRDFQLHSGLTALSLAAIAGEF